MLLLSMFNFFDLWLKAVDNVFFFCENVVNEGYQGGQVLNRALSIFMHLLIFISLSISLFILLKSA